jgi:hypothetical protein
MSSATPNVARISREESMSEKMSNVDTLRELTAEELDRVAAGTLFTFGLEKTGTGFPPSNPFIPPGELGVGFNGANSHAAKNL